MNECKFFCEQLSDYIDGQIDEDECRYLEEHLKNCPPCSSMLASLKITVQLCERALPAEIPDDVRVALKEFLRSHCKQCI